MVALFPNTPQSKKDNIGSEPMNDNNLICRALEYKKNIKMKLD